MQFPDGQLPSKDLIKRWLGIVDEFFADDSAQVDGKELSAGIEKRNKGDEIKRIGVHCLAGLGRAPFFVAIALVNKGCTPQNAIDLIRKNRPGALNLAQAYYILEFKGKSNCGKHSGNASCKCSIF